MTDRNYTIFPMSEQQRLDLMSSDQRRLYTIEKRLTTSATGSLMTRIFERAAERVDGQPKLRQLVIK